MSLKRLSPKTGLKILLFLCLLVVTKITITLFRQIEYDQNPKDPGTTLVLTYTTIWREHGGNKIFENRRNPNCKYKCEYTDDKRQLYRADVVIFHGASMDILPANSLLLRPRPPELYDQLWVFTLYESPESFPDAGLLPYPNVFNWTMSYRQDSDTQWPYFTFTHKNQSGKALKLPFISLNTTTLRSKRLAVAMISHCIPFSRRIEYVTLMQKYVQVDFYGKCGPGDLVCPKPFDCYETLGSKYKFFLAFENSFCQDYVTEKAVAPMLYGMVPVVRGGANYSQILPPGSYINVQDFSTVQELTDYLQLLDKDDDLYRRYFDWRVNYEIHQDQECQTCQKFHTFDSNRDRKTYANIYDWHHNNNTGQGQCWDPLFPTQSRLEYTWEMTVKKYWQILQKFYWGLLSRIF